MRGPGSSDSVEQASWRRLARPSRTEDGRLCETHVIDGDEHPGPPEEPKRCEADAALSDLLSSRSSREPSFRPGSRAIGELGAMVRHHDPAAIHLNGTLRGQYLTNSPVPDAGTSYLRQWSGPDQRIRSRFRFGQDPESRLRRFRLCSGRFDPVGCATARSGFTSRLSSRRPDPRICPVITRTTSPAGRASSEARAGGRIGHSEVDPGPAQHVRISPHPAAIHPHLDVPGRRDLRIGPRDDSHGTSGRIPTQRLSGTARRLTPSPRPGRPDDRGVHTIDARSEPRRCGDARRGVPARTSSPSFRRFLPDAGTAASNPPPTRISARSRRRFNPPELPVGRTDGLEWLAMGVGGIGP